MDNLIENSPELTQGLVSLEDRLNGQPSPWESLPTEIVQYIAEHALLADGRNTASPNSYDPSKSPYPVDAFQPDLALARVNHHSRAIVEDFLLPASVVVEIRQHTCRRCVHTYPFMLDDDTPFLQIFSATEFEPWSYLLKKASVISIDVRCNGSDCGGGAPISTTATIYRPDNGLNVLALSQLIMISSRNREVRRTIDVRCTTRSTKGARQSIEFLRALAELVHGIDVGQCSVDGILAYLRPNVLPEDLTPTIDQLRRKRETWTDTAVPAQEAFLAVAQHLLDQEKATTHQIAMTAIQALVGRAPQLFNPLRANEPSRMVEAKDLHKSVMGTFREDYMRFIVLHGISEYTVRQLKERYPSKHPLLPEKGNSIFIHDMSDRFKELLQICKAQRGGRFREWQVDDLQYLIHQAAILQSSIRFRAAVFLASFQSIWSDELALSKLFETQTTFRVLEASQSEQEDEEEDQEEAEQKYKSFRHERIQIYTSWLREELSKLQRLDEKIGVLRDNMDEGDGYDDYEIADFINAVIILLDEVEPLINHEELHDETLRTLDTSGLMIPKRLRIPVVLDWEGIFTTFRSLNQAQFFWGRWWI